MKLTAATIVLLLSFVPVALAHRLDEYLQATTIMIEHDHVIVTMRLTPGVAVADAVLPEIDRDWDGVISKREQTNYAERVREDLSLAIDGQGHTLRLISTRFSAIEDLKQGLGDIDLTFTALVSRGNVNRALSFENRHHRGIGAYLVNCLVPSDPDIRIVSQARNYEQSTYQVRYMQTYPIADSTPVAAEVRGWSNIPGWLSLAAVVLKMGRVLVGRRFIAA